MHIGDTLHHVGLTIILISIIAHIAELILASRQLTESSWLSELHKVAPYSLWVGVVLIFAGILVRDRNWSRRRTGSN